MTKHLKEAVERIADEAAEERCEVLVRLERAEDADDGLLAAAAAGVGRRGLIQSARELMPPSLAELQTLRGLAGTRGGGRARRRTPDDAGGSLVAQTARMQVTPQKVRAHKKAAQESMQAAMKSDLMQELAGAAPATRTRSRGRAPASPGVPTFWTSRTMLLEVDRSDLARIPEGIPGLADVHVNRTLRLPRIVEAKSLPANVADNKTSAWGIEACGALAAWGAYGVTGEGAKIAVLDTGVDASHPDLDGKVSDWAEFDPRGMPVPGSEPHDSGKHGTHVCGTIAGGGESNRWIGVAPGANLAVGLVLQGGGGTDAQILAGMDWAIELGVDAINMSLGGLTLGPDVPSTYSAAILSAIRAGIPVVTAIGNEGSQTSGSPGNDFFAFSVGATDSQDRAGGFSGGRTQIVRASRFFDRSELPLPYSKPDISAPGVAVQSSVPGGGYEALNGTSMATPHVAGAMALLLEATTIRDEVEGAERAYLLQDLLTATVEELGEAGMDHRFGFGRLDILRALGYADELGYI